MNIELLKSIVKEIKNAPEDISQLMTERKDIGCKMSKKIEEQKKYEIVFMAKVADGSDKYSTKEQKEAKARELLAKNENYLKIMKEIEELTLRKNASDILIDEKNRSYSNNNKILDLTTAFINAGMKNEANDVLESYCQEDKRVAEVEVNTNEKKEIKKEESQNNENKDKFLVLEARETKPGTVRAYCQMPDGSKVAVFGKNGIDKKLMSSIGKEIEIAYSTLNKGLFAISIN